MINAIQGYAAPIPQATGQREDPERVKEAAQQFEALLIAKLMQDVRESGGRGSLGEEDQAGEQAISFAHQHMAEALARSGGLGLAKMITAQVATKAAGNAVQAELQKMPMAAKRVAPKAD